LSIVLSVTLLSGFGRQTCGAADDWPRFGGPDGDGISRESDWSPDALKSGAKTVWKVNVGGGWSSVAVVGDKLYTMGNKADADYVVCLNTKDGSNVWSQSYSCKAGDHPGPRATPTVDGGNVYTFSKEGDVLCFDAAAGTVKWQRNLAKDLKLKGPTWGFAGSAFVNGNLILLNAGKKGPSSAKSKPQK